MMDEDRFQQLVRNAKHARSKGGYEMNVHDLLPGHIDEVSILLTSTEDEEAFLRIASHHVVTEPGWPEFYHTDAQVFMKVINAGTIKERKEYAYHARFHFYKMDGWRIQTQTLWHVNPVTRYEAPMFSFMPGGGVVHVSWKVPDLDTWNCGVLPNGLRMLGRYETSHGASMYIGNGETALPLLHPRAPKVT